MVAALFVLGLAVGRWLVVALPAAAFLVLHLALSRDDWYSEVPEDWQAAAYIGLIGGTVAAAAGVFVATQRRPT